MSREHDTADHGVGGSRRKESSMKKKQFLALFLCSLVPWTIGNGLAPLLPVYAARLEASPSMAGCQLSLSYVALAVGTLSASWLSDKLRQRKVLIISGGLVGIPALWLMGMVRNIWAVTAASALWYFWAGISMTLINILAGLLSDEHTRGKVFGILALNTGLGSLIGGLAMGPIADRWGYQTMFLVLSLFGLLWPILGLFLRDEGAARAEGPDTKATRPAVRLGKSFYLLFLASLAATLGCYVFTMGRSLIMDALGFGAADISTTSAISEIPLLPLPLLLGWLSDRVGRKRFLLLGFLSAMASLLGLMVSTSLWHFWVTSTLITVPFVTGAVGTALVTDLVPKEALGQGLSLFGATNWIGGILGCAAAGYAVQHLGPVPTLAAGALLPVIAVILLSAIRQARSAEEARGLRSGEALSAGPLSATA
jgi:MFS family permease